MSRILVLGNVPEKDIVLFRMKFPEIVEIEFIKIDDYVVNRVIDTGLVLRFCIKHKIKPADIIGAIYVEPASDNTDTLAHSFLAEDVGHAWPELRYVGIVHSRHDGQGTWLEFIPTCE